MAAILRPVAMSALLRRLPAGLSATGTGSAAAQEATAARANPVVGNIASGFGAGSARRFASDAMEGEKVYYSQSACWMTVPGTAGLRLLDLSLAGRKDATPAQAAALASAGVSTVMLPPLDPGDGQLAALAEAVARSGGVPSALVEGDAGKLAALREAGVQEAVLEVDMSGEGLNERMEAAIALAEAAAAAEMPLRAVLRSAFAPDPDFPEDNALAEELGEAVVTLADAGSGMACGAITLADCAGAASEESLRDALEAAMGADVRGEALVERLSLRLRAAELLPGALGLGITRFEAAAGGGGGLLSPMEVLRAAEAAELRHQLDATKLRDVEG